MLRRVERLGIDLDRSGVGEGELDLKLRFARTERESNRVAILFRLLRCLGDDGLAVGSPCLRRLELRAIGQVELEVVVVHLCLRWSRRVVDREQTLAVQLSTVGLETEYIGGHAEV